MFRNVPRILYLAPVPYASMAQRPHHLVHFLAHQVKAEVVWVEPMPSRLPRLNDLVLRLKETAQTHEGRQRIPNVQVIPAPAFPAEPLSDGLVDLVTQRLTTQVMSHGSFDHLIIGKPSRLAIRLAKQLSLQSPGVEVTWDIMDDMPAFHTGRAAKRMQRQADALWSVVDSVWVSSSELLRLSTAALADRGSTVFPQLVLNGIESKRYLGQTRSIARKGDGRSDHSDHSDHSAESWRARLCLGYVGSIAPWMDWAQLSALAQARPQDTIELIGPVHIPVPILPPNIRLLPAVDHAEVPSVLEKFDWGLIPFVNNRLTRAVDPIKYYEYRAAGLPVLSTAFGEMRERTEPDGVWFWDEALKRPRLMDEVVAVHQPVGAEWIGAQDWSVRFGSHLPYILK